jgi:hypothetical protein
LAWVFDLAYQISRALFSGTPVMKEVVRVGINLWRHDGADDAPSRPEAGAWYQIRVDL